MLWLPRCQPHQQGHKSAPQRARAAGGLSCWHLTGGAPGKKYSLKGGCVLVCPRAYEGAQTACFHETPCSSQLQHALLVFTPTINTAQLSYPLVGINLCPWPASCSHQHRLNPASAPAHVSFLGLLHLYRVVLLTRWQLAPLRTCLPSACTKPAGKACGGR